MIMRAQLEHKMFKGGVIIILNNTGRRIHTLKTEIRLWFKLHFQLLASYCFRV